MKSEYDSRKIMYIICLVLIALTISYVAIQLMACTESDNTKDLFYRISTKATGI